MMFLVTPRTFVDRCLRPLDLILAGNPPFVDVLHFLSEKVDFNCYKRESTRVYSITCLQVASSSPKDVPEQHNKSTRNADVRLQIYIRPSVRTKNK